MINQLRTCARSALRDASRGAFTALLGLGFFKASQSRVENTLSSTANDGIKLDSTPLAKPEVHEYPGIKK